MPNSHPTRCSLSPLPANEQEALDWLMLLVAAVDGGSLAMVPIADFRRGWFALGYLYPGLHPDDALDHGSEVSKEGAGTASAGLPDVRLVQPFYAESGWPVVLAPVANEARRRYEAGALTDDEFYCAEAVLAGMRHRDLRLGAPA